MSNTNPAVVLGLNPNGLGIVRSMHAAGVPVVAVEQAINGATDAYRWMSSHTRLCRKVYYDDTDGLLDCLISLGKTLPAQGVLFPSSDDQLLCVSRNRDVLSEYYRFRVPRPELLELLEDKGRFYPLVEKQGVAIPLTFVEPRPDNIDETAARIKYPCLIKPRFPDTVWYRSFPGKKALVAADSSQLTDLFRHVYAKYPEVLIQEVIPGPDSNLYFSHAYLSEDLKPLAIWTGRKIRQHPIHFGTSTMTETVWLDAVADATITILQELACSGYASIEFKLDPRDEQYKIMEVTPGRTWYPHYLGFGAGVNIPYIWYQDLLGRAETTASRADDGVRWIDEYRDIFAIYDYWRHGELTIVEWLRSYRGLRVFAYSSFKDPLPIILVVLRFIIAIPLKLKRSLHRLRGSKSRSR
jgi:predicted ATP-grasp superfamily ATP-dependent carboligase